MVARWILRIPSWRATTPARVSTAMPVGADIIRPPSGGPASGGPTFFPKESGGKERAGRGISISPALHPPLETTKKGVPTPFLDFPPSCSTGGFPAEGAYVVTPPRLGAGAHTGAPLRGARRLGAPYHFMPVCRGLPPGDAPTRRAPRFWCQKRGENQQGRDFEFPPLHPSLDRPRRGNCDSPFLELPPSCPTGSFPAEGAYIVTPPRLGAGAHTGAPLRGARRPRRAVSKPP